MQDSHEGVVESERQDDARLCGDSARDDVSLLGIRGEISLIYSKRSQCEAIDAQKYLKAVGDSCTAIQYGPNIRQRETVYLLLQQTSYMGRRSNYDNRGNIKSQRNGCRLSLNALSCVAHETIRSQAVSDTGSFRLPSVRRLPAATGR